MSIHQLNLYVYCSIFEVSNEGQITLSGDREDYKSNEYSINIVAEDGGSSPRSTTTTVKIFLNLPGKLTK